MWQSVRIALLIVLPVVVIAVGLANGLDALLIALAVIVVPPTVVAIPAAAIAAIARRSPRWAGKFAAGCAFAAGMAFALYGVIVAEGSSPSCDGMCISQTGLRVIYIVLGISIGGFVALLSAPIASAMRSLVHRARPQTTHPA